MADDDKLKILEDRLTRLEAVLAQRPPTGGGMPPAAAWWSIRRLGAAAAGEAGYSTRGRALRRWSIRPRGGRGWGRPRYPWPTPVVDPAPWASPVVDPAPWAQGPAVASPARRPRRPSDASATSAIPRRSTSAPCRSRSSSPRSTGSMPKRRGSIRWRQWSSNSWTSEAKGTAVAARRTATAADRDGLSGRGKVCPCEDCHPLQLRSRHSIPGSPPERPPDRLPGPGQSRVALSHVGRQRLGSSARSS